MNNRAASEVTGTLLLIGLIITTTTLIRGGVLAGTASVIEQTERTHVSIDPDLNGTTVSLQHTGGPKLDTSFVEILLIGDSGRVGPHRLDSAAVSGNGLSDSTLEIGDTVTVDHSFSGLMDIYLYSTKTNERLYYTVRSPYTSQSLPGVSEPGDEFLGLDPSEGTGFGDADGDGVYDDGEEVYTEEELESFDDPTVDLTITSAVEEIKTEGYSLEIRANTITSESDFRATGDNIILIADGDIDIQDSKLESNGNNIINVTSINGQIRADRASINAKSGPIELNSDGDINVEDATLNGKDKTTDLGTENATLSVGGTAIQGGSAELVYSPDGVSVDGSPSEGTVTSV